MSTDSSTWVVPSSSKTVARSALSASLRANPALQQLKRRFLIKNSPFKKSRWKEVVYEKQGGLSNMQGKVVSVLMVAFLVALGDSLINLNNLDGAITFQITLAGYPLAMWAILGYMGVGTLMALAADPITIERTERIPPEQYYPPQQYWDTVSDEELEPLLK